MQKLHLVGFTADFDGLIFAARKGAKSGSFVVPIDGRLLQQIAEAERHRDGGGRGSVARDTTPRLTRPESSLGPREMQDRIRSGWTLDEVAAEAGVDHDWVRRFAAPVLAEVAQVIDRAQGATFDKPRVGASALPLAASVRRNVVERGVRLAEDELAEGWAAWQLDDERWLVRFAYRSRGRLQEAEWAFDPDGGELVSRNRLASQLGHVAAGRRRPPAPVRRAVPSPPAAKGSRPAARSAKAAKPTPVTKATRAGAKATKAGATSAVKATKPVAKASRSKASRSKASGSVSKSTRTPKAPTAVIEQTKVTRGTRVTKPVARPVKAGKPVAKANTSTSATMAITRRPAAVPTRGTVLPPPVRTALAPSAPSTVARSATPRAMAPRTAPARAPRTEPLQPDRGAVPDPAAWLRRAPTPTDGHRPSRDGRGPLPAPAPAPRSAPPQPGPAAVDEAAGLARIDSRRTSSYVSGPDTTPSGPVFRGDLGRAERPTDPLPPGRRRREQLRAP